MSAHDPASEDLNWWTFSLLHPGDPMPEPVNTPVDGRHELTYTAYLQLEKILGAQRPSSTAPDERAFIITHQLFELCFKLMLFDFVVLRRTLAETMALDSRDLLAVCTEINHPLWIPGRSAAARLRYVSNLIGKLFGIIHAEGFSTPAPEADFTFRADEFHSRFRSNLPPASGFQSWQFRVIQLAFGKSPILALQYFDANVFYANYANETDRHDLISVLDPIIFGGAQLASRGGELATLSTLDHELYGVLSRLGEIWKLQPEQIPVPAHEESLADIREAFRAMLTAFYGDRKREREERVSAFMERLEAVCAEEWTGTAERPSRLQAFGLARAAWRKLQETHPYGGLTKCIALLGSADRAFSSFLPAHFNTAKRAKLDDDDAGSAGGGIRFLSLSQELAKLFPMLRALI